MINVRPQSRCNADSDKFEVHDFSSDFDAPVPCRRQRSCHTTNSGKAWFTNPVRVNGQEREKKQDGKACRAGKV
jgi:hypothetical protein